MKALECSQDFSYYKSMGIFRFGQGQLTPQPLVRSALNSNLNEELKFLGKFKKKKIGGGGSGEGSGWGGGGGGGGGQGGCE